MTFLSPQILIPPSVHHGEPALRISLAMVNTLSKPFKFALIGKFSHDRSTMEKSRLFFNKIGLKGTFSFDHLDLKHMLIRLQHEGYFNQLWMKESIFIEGFPMKVFRWTVDFRSDVESLIIRIWMSLPNHPLFLFDK